MDVEWIDGWRMNRKIPGNGWWVHGCGDGDQWG